MRKGLVFLCVVLLILGFAGMSNASLQVVGDGDYVYDTEAKIWWWADLRTFGPFPDGEIKENTYANQISYIEEMEGNWHMATLDEIEGLALNPEQEIADSFIPTRSSSFDWYYGRYDEGFDMNYRSYHYCASLMWGGSIEGEFYIDWFFEKDDSRVNPGLGAWVCTDTNPVPIPGAVWLLGSGLIGIVGIRRRYRN